MKMAISLLMSPENADLIISVARSEGINNFEIVANKDFNIDNACSAQSLFNGIKLDSFFQNKDVAEKYKLILIERIKLIYNKYNCKNFVFGNPKFRNTFTKEQYDTAIEFFRSICDNIPNDAILSLENNPKEYGTNFGFTLGECVSIIKDVNRNNFKINFDIGGFLKSKENTDIILSNISLINHVHVSRFNLLSLSELNKRDILEYKNIINILKNNYNKYVSLETNLKDINEQIIRNEIQVFKEILR